ncbi:MAG: PTS mannitol transporter subunit EIICBA, partial [Lachnospiraceae bacterium]|nr:PTS mannitol transporter subunit EIICBA [Lachnospiraceae bacterium]
MSEQISWRVKAQRFGGKLSAMVVPNLGAFMGWGILTALGIWLGNDMLKGFITPILNYLLPVLIGVAAGRMVYGEKGAVIGAFTTMGVVIGSDTTMLLGAMIIAPFAAWALKKVDALVEPHTPSGFELLIGN